MVAAAAESPRTLVVGASGFVGNYLVRELENAGHEVIQANFPDFNLLNREQVESLVQQTQFRYIVNLAAISSVGASWNCPTDTMDVNVKGTLHLLEAVRKYSKGSKVLLIGSAEEYDSSVLARENRVSLKETDPLCANNPYGISKIAQENFANLYRLRYGMNVVCTRSFNHTGVGQTENFVLPSFCKQVADIEKTQKSGKILVGNLDVWRDFSDVSDVVRVYRMLLEQENEFDVYNVGSGKAYHLKSLLEDVILKFASVQIDVVVDPEKVRPVEIQRLCADNSRVQKYWPGTDIVVTLRKMYDHFLNS